ncbi:MAG TPA: class I SAM-dependent methyltransferase [Tenuifilaceae bacterium]|nr:class I SAM-dependent methyltransferase [Tenuifilaceae bacterium]
MLKKAFKKVLRFVEIQKRELRTMSLLDVLKKSTDKDLARFAEVVKQDKQNAFAEQELSAFGLVDKKRLQLLNSKESIVVQDFGAGNPDSSRTQAQIVDGVSGLEEVSSICKNASTPENLGRLLFKLIAEFKPKCCLELGTSLGISASYQVLALKSNGHGRFVTIEGSQSIAKIAEQTIEELGYPNFDVHVGKFKDVLPIILPTIGTVDFVFIDGHHDKFATKEYFETIFPYLSEKSIVIFDDIDWSKGMGEFWDEMNHDSRVKFSFDLFRWGVCFIDKHNSESRTQSYKIIV